MTVARFSPRALADRLNRFGDRVDQMPTWKRALIVIPTLGAITAGLYGIGAPLHDAMEASLAASEKAAADRATVATRELCDAFEHDRYPNVALHGYAARPHEISCDVDGKRFTMTIPGRADQYYPTGG